MTRQMIPVVTCVVVMAAVPPCANARDAVRQIAAVVLDDRDALEQSRADRERAREDQQRARDDQERAREDQARAKDDQARARNEQAYERGRDSIEREQWTRAVEQFGVVIADGAPRADAALYWRAYAFDKLNRAADALTSVAELMKSFPNSRWLSDGRALELQIRQRAGQPVSPDTQSDDELKLLAIQGLQHSDPEQAVPLLEKLLQGNQSPRLKERALFVLAQSGSSRAHDVIARIARGGANPDLQEKAIQYLGVNGTEQNRQLLSEVYQSSSDIGVKRSVLRAFMVSGDKARMLNLATTEKNPELRQEAVRQLGPMGAREELWQMYQKESSADVKRKILGALFVSGDSAHLIDVANSEQNVELRRRAIQHLGTMGRTSTGEALVGLYAKEKEFDIKRTVINSLFTQNNAESLVAIARKETDPALKREMVSKLSLMTRSKVAMDYLMEILNK